MDDAGRNGVVESVAEAAYSLVSGFECGGKNGVSWADGGCELSIFAFSTVIFQTIEICDSPLRT